MQVDLNGALQAPVLHSQEYHYLLTANRRPTYVVRQRKV